MRSRLSLAWVVDLSRSCPGRDGLTRNHAEATDELQHLQVPRADPVRPHPPRHRRTPSPPSSLPLSRSSRAPATSTEGSVRPTDAADHVRTHRVCAWSAAEVGRKPHSHAKWLRAPRPHFCPQPISAYKTVERADWTPRRAIRPYLTKAQSLACCPPWLDATEVKSGNRRSGGRNIGATDTNWYVADRAGPRRTCPGRR